jgi:hypothetical protein
MDIQFDISQLFSHQLRNGTFLTDHAPRRRNAEPIAAILAH